MEMVEGARHTDLTTPYRDSESFATQPAFTLTSLPLAGCLRPRTWLPGCTFPNTALLSPGVVNSRVTIQITANRHQMDSE